MLPNGVRRRSVPWRRKRRPAQGRVARPSLRLPVKSPAETAVTVTVASEETAKVAGLRYVSDERAGITRRRSGKSFRYTGPKDSPVRDVDTLSRIRRLAIPPAWKDVWICPLENGHLQATGRDARGRKQYRYHPHWREVRDEVKYERVLAFGAALPRIRRRVSRDLRRKDLGRERVLASLIRLLETTLIRVGNDEYAQQNRSYGLTTMRNRHAKVRGCRIVFEFVGKSGKRHRVDLENPAVAKVVRRCQDLPGQDLFEYVDENGEVRNVHSEDVNDYLREIATQDFSAKDFRTWAGTVLAAVALREFEQFTSQRQAKRNLAQAVEAVAKMLGNTPTICRKCYVHPAILDGYMAGETIASLKDSADQKLGSLLRKLRPEEAAVMMFLWDRLAQAKKAGGARRLGRPVS